jgi:hypothetical protein
MSKRSLHFAAFTTLLAITGGTLPTHAQQTGTAPRANTKAESRDQAADLQGIYLISAKAGGINLVSGGVEILRAKAPEWRKTNTGTRLKAGDSVRTAADGHTEILLNPGSYLRLDGNSEITLTNPSLDALRVNVARGNALFEVTGVGDTKLVLTVTTPKGDFQILKTGLYRVSIAADDATEVAVWKGEVKAGTAQAITVKGRRKVILNGNTAVAADLDKKAQDGFDEWSKARAKDLANANARLSYGAVNNGIAGYQANGAYGFGYRPFFGLWMFDARMNCVTFFPFYSYWSSPYGYGYNASYGLPWNLYTPGSYPIYPNGTTGNGGGVAGNGGGQAGSPPRAMPKSPGGDSLPALPGRNFPSPSEIVRQNPGFDPSERSFGGYNNGGFGLPAGVKPGITAAPAAPASGPAPIAKPKGQ